MGNESIIKKLWLNCLCEHEPARIAKCIKLFGSADELYDSPSVTFARLRALGKDGIKLDKSLDMAKEIYNYCEYNSIMILSIDDEKYPEKLRNVNCPPQIIYVKGTLPPIDQLFTLCVVGTRKATSNGLECAYGISRRIAEYGAVVVSGMAVGIDREAHVGTLHSGQKTVAVLAGGVDKVYPIGNRDLYDVIIENGAVVSERPPLWEGDGSLYSQRNRIMVGLSTAVLVVEGGKRSGTSITAKCANDNGRDVFAVPSSPNLYTSYLPNSLIRDGATATRDADDILAEYGMSEEQFKYGIEFIGNPVQVRRDRMQFKGSGAGKSKKANYTMQKTSKRINTEKPAEVNYNIENILNTLNTKEQIIVKYLYNNKDNGVHIDEVARNTGIPISDVGGAVVLLQMKGILKQEPGSICSLSERSYR